MAEGQERSEEMAKQMPVHCRNCGEPIIWNGQNPTGWTHGNPRVPAQWQGKRCPHRVTGAVPDTDRLAVEAHRAGREYATREIHDELNRIRDRIKSALRVIELSDRWSTSLGRSEQRGQCNNP